MYLTNPSIIKLRFNALSNNFIQKISISSCLYTLFTKSIDYFAEIYRKIVHHISVTKKHFFVTQKMRFLCMNSIFCACADGGWVTHIESPAELTVLIQQTSVILLFKYLGPAVYCIGRRQNQKPQVKICPLTLIFFNKNYKVEMNF